MHYLALLQDQEIPGIGISTGMLTIIIVFAVLLITAVSLIPMIVIFKRLFGGIKQTNA